MTALPENGTGASTPDAGAAEPLSLLDLLLVLAHHRRRLVLLPLLVGVLALGATFLLAPTFTATTTFLPPQQQQSAAASALSSLGALSGLAGVAGGIRSPSDQYVSLLQSVGVRDRLIDEFKLREVYDKKLRVEARQELDRNVRVLLGKKDGLITVEVDDEDPQRAAAIANRHIDELRRLTSELALTEAQQRRVFFEGLLENSRKALTSAQSALQRSGFNQGALRAEPKAAADAYARMRAEVTATEVRLQTLRRAFAEGAPEVQGQLTRLTALREQLRRLEGNLETGPQADYVGRYREFKYQETLFELFARQFELARVDESREGALIQVIDAAQPPERKSKPRRAVIAVTATLLAFLATLVFVLLRHGLRRAAADPITAAKLNGLKAELKLRGAQDPAL